MVYNERARSTDWIKVALPIKDKAFHFQVTIFFVNLVIRGWKWWKDNGQPEISIPRYCQGNYFSKIPNTLRISNLTLEEVAWLKVIWDLTILTYCLKWKE